MSFNSFALATDSGVLPVEISEIIEDIGEDTAPSNQYNKYISIAGNEALNFAKVTSLTFLASFGSSVYEDDDFHNLGGIKDLIITGGCYDERNQYLTSGAYRAVAAYVLYTAWRLTKFGYHKLTAASEITVDDSDASTEQEEFVDSTESEIVPAPAI
jgi:hypothetical protein